MSGIDTTLTTEGIERTRHVTALGDHRLYLLRTDDTSRWSEGHADWVCERCGVHGDKLRDFKNVRCEVS